MEYARVHLGTTGRIRIFTMIIATERPNYYYVPSMNLICHKSRVYLLSVHN